jgi:hypothetical protein
MSSPASVGGRRENGTLFGEERVLLGISRKMGLAFRMQLSASEVDRR